MKSNKKNNCKTVKPVYKNFLYLMPDNSRVSEMAEKLTFLNEDQLEVWMDYNLLEITTENGTITFEDYMDNLHKEDTQVMEALGMKQLYSCEYNQLDVALVQKVMQTMLEAFGGKLGSDTENFEPFIKLENL